MQNIELEMNQLFLRIGERARDALLNMPEVPHVIKDLSQLLDEITGLYCDWQLAERQRMNREERP